jgi:hypothetical protein
MLASSLMINGVRSCATRSPLWVRVLELCIGSMAKVILEISLADSGSLSTESISDLQASFEIERLPDPPNRIRALLNQNEIDYVLTFRLRLPRHYHRILHARG